MHLFVCPKKSLNLLELFVYIADLDRQLLTSHPNKCYNHGGTTVRCSLIMGETRYKGLQESCAVGYGFFVFREYDIKKDGSKPSFFMSCFLSAFTSKRAAGSRSFRRMTRRLFLRGTAR